MKIMNAMQKIEAIEADGLPQIVNVKNDRARQRAERARAALIEKLRKNLAEQLRIDPNEGALQMHLSLFEKAYACTDGNLWQIGEEYVLR